MPQQTSDLMVIVSNQTAFRTRLAYLLGVQAMIVRIEAVETANHAERDALAQRVITDPQAFSNGYVLVFLGRPGASAGGFIYGEDGVTPIGLGAEDASLLGQLAADWNVMAGL